MLRCLCVMLGGGVGSLVRYLVGRAMSRRFPDASFALGTFCVNVTGSFLIGLLMGILVERLRLPHYWQLTVVVGFLGGYTTFSSFEYDAYLNARGGHLAVGVAYLAASVVFGYAAVWLGAWLAAKH